MRHLEREGENGNQLLFHLPHTENRATENNLSTQSSENEDDGNISQEEEEEKEVPQNVQQKK